MSDNPKKASKEIVHTSLVMITIQLCRNVMAHAMVVYSQWFKMNNNKP